MGGHVIDGARGGRAWPHRHPAVTDFRSEGSGSVFVRESSGARFTPRTFKE